MINRNPVLGAIIGDIAGSRHEFIPHKSKDFVLLDEKRCYFTDDTVMTVAVCDALCSIASKKGPFPSSGYFLELRRDKWLSAVPDAATESMRRIGCEYPNAGYGNMFGGWLYMDKPHLLDSYGNGAAMRVSGCACAADSLETALALSDAVTGITHNHPEGIKGARAVTESIFLALTGATKDEVKAAVEEKYYLIPYTLDDIRKTYSYDVTCQGSVPQSILCFLESESFEDAVRNAVSLGGDADTMAAIAGSIAAAYYGISDSLAEQALCFLDEHLKSISENFNRTFK